MLLFPPKVQEFPYLALKCSFKELSIRAENLIGRNKLFTLPQDTEMIQNITKQFHWLVQMTVRDKERLLMFAMYNRYYLLLTCPCWFLTEGLHSELASKDTQIQKFLTSLVCCKLTCRSAVVCLRLFSHQTLFCSFCSAHCQRMDSPLLEINLFGAPHSGL